MKNKYSDELRIAFATSNGDELDEHFGNCQQLAIYHLTPTSNEHVNTVKFQIYEQHNQQKINERLMVLKNCFAVYCLACGNPVRRQLLAQNTRVVIHPHNILIQQLITKIQSRWPGAIAARQTKQRNRKKENNYFTQLAESEWE